MKAARGPAPVLRLVVALAASVALLVPAPAVAQTSGGPDRIDDRAYSSSLAEQLRQSIDARIDQALDNFPILGITLPPDRSATVKIMPALPPSAPAPTTPGSMPPTPPAIIPPPPPLLLPPPPPPPQPQALGVPQNAAAPEANAPSTPASPAPPTTVEQAMAVPEDRAADVKVAGETASQDQAATATEPQAVASAEDDAKADSATEGSAGKDTAGSEATPDVSVEEILAKIGEPETADKDEAGKEPAAPKQAVLAGLVAWIPAALLGLVAMVGISATVIRKNLLSKP